MHAGCAGQTGAEAPRTFSGQRGGASCGQHTRPWACQVLPGLLMCSCAQSSARQQCSTQACSLGLQRGGALHELTRLSVCCEPEAVRASPHPGPARGCWSRSVSFSPTRLLTGNTPSSPLGSLFISASALLMAVQSIVTHARQSAGASSRMGQHGARVVASSALHCTEPAGMQGQPRPGHCQRACQGQGPA